MQLDWNIEEINELRKRAGVQVDNEAVTAQLKHLDFHLGNHQMTRSFELRKKMWESVEACATKLDRLLTPERPLTQRTARHCLFGLGLWMPDAPKIREFSPRHRRHAIKLALIS